MAEEIHTSSFWNSSTPNHGFSAGLAIVLPDEGGTDNLSKRPGILSCTEDNEKRELERTLGHVFDVNTAASLIGPDHSGFDPSIFPAVLKCGMRRFYVEGGVDVAKRDGCCIFENGCGKDIVKMDEGSPCGDMRFMNGSLLLESQAMFSSARANACVWKGKWMYEVTLETAGIQQIGWATLTCPFTRNEGVGDDEDSYAYDGRRMRKWNKDPQSYGQLWVAGDVIGCCIDLDSNEILFYRNGVSLGVAFHGVKKPESGYFPAISLSQGERSEVNFGSKPFQYPIEGFHPLQPPPLVKDGESVAFTSDLATYLLRCLMRLVKLCCGASSSMRMLKRSSLIEQLFYPAGQEICKQFFLLLQSGSGVKEYVIWCGLVPLLVEAFEYYSPHDYTSMDKVLDLFQSFSEFKELVIPIMQVLAYKCKTSMISLVQCPYTGSYPYLALACHILKREDVMVHWWMSSEFESSMEGLLSRKGPNKQDLHELVPVVWWPGCREDLSSENNMRDTTVALSRAIDKVEEMQFELCRLLINFSPSSRPSESRGSAFRTFLQNLIWKNRGADRNVLPPGLSNNSVLVSIYTVLLHFLSEGFGMDDTSGFLKNSRQPVENGAAFLHRGGKRVFPVALFLKGDSHRVDFSRLGGTLSHLLKAHPVTDKDMEEILWDECFFDNEETLVTHSSRQKPCCCSSFAAASHTGSGKKLAKVVVKSIGGHSNTIPDRTTVSTDFSARTYADEIEDKPSTSEQSASEIVYHPLQCRAKAVSRLKQVPTGALREEELFDTTVLLYHLGLTQNFKQASSYMSHQAHSISLLEDTDKQIRTEKTCSEHLRRLKEARNVYREDLVDCIRQCSWYKVTLLARWKQRGMYALCMWISQLLLVLSNSESIFRYVPEFYVETLIDCFHALRRSDPPFVSSAALIPQGLSSFVTFLAMHFNDPRIANAELREVLLQSISVLVQYKDFMYAFESNRAATNRMPEALLQTFDNRFWIPVTNILLRLCKGSGFGASRHSEAYSNRFQGLLREKCTSDEKLFASFLNRLFNTLSWTITEFSVSLKEMTEHYQIPDLQQRKCAIIFELSCNLARLLEFFTSEVPQAFLCGSATNIMRVAELTVFVLSHTTLTADAEIFDSMLRQPGQSRERVNRAMVLAPLVGMILNLSSKAKLSPAKTNNSLLQAFASMDCTESVESNLRYLLDFNWASVFKGDASLVKIAEIRCFIEKLKTFSNADTVVQSLVSDNEEEICCICYASKIDTIFVPCNHKSCHQCISRHLLNSQRCFFCNSIVKEVCSVTHILAPEGNSYMSSDGINTMVAEGGTLIKPDEV